MRKIVMTLLALSALLVGGIGLAGSAQAISRDHIDLSWVEGQIHYADGQYTGRLIAKTEICVRMERKTSAGDWVTSGFWVGSITGDVTIDCNASYAPIWETHNGSAFYGLRIYGGGAYATFCDTKPNCQAIGA